MKHHKAVIIGSFNIGLLVFGLTYLFLNATFTHKGDFLALIGLSGTLLVSIAFVLHHYKRANSEK